jgi:hypothetical protein
LLSIQDPLRRVIDDLRHEEACMTGSLQKVAIATTFVLLAAAAISRADVTGSSEGQITGRKIATPIPTAAVFTQSGRTVSGTVAVGGEGFAGAYLVHGIATPKRLRVSGALNGVMLKLTARITGDASQGRIRLKGTGSKLVGTLALTKNPPVGDGASCDAVFSANQTTFTDQMLHGALVNCTACHIPGGQAADTRFHVATTDPLATARAIVPFVDSADPAASRIVQKPLLLVPHGGGQQILSGSAEETELRSWVALIAAAGCS